MSLTIPILLLIIGGLILWVLIESNISWIFKSICTITLCIFTICLFKTLHSFLGWPSVDNPPERVTIEFVDIKEPNKSIGSKGRIYLLLDSIKSKYDSKILNLMGYCSKIAEPRLFSIPYSRKLHEELEKEVIPKLKNGQKVKGKLSKSGGGKGKKGDKNNKENNKNGGGSESQEQEYMFYELTPAEIQSKQAED